MLTALTSEARLTDAGVAIDIIGAEAVILTRVAGAVINVDITVNPSPSWLTDTLIPEQLVHTFSSDTGIRLTQIHLGLTSLASEASGTVAAEVIDHVCTVSSQQTRLLQTIINVILAVSALPALCALTGVATLGQSPARGSIATRVAILRARVSGDVTVLALEAVSTQTLKVIRARQVFAHGAVRAGALYTVADLVLALEPSEAILTLTGVALGLVNTGGAIITRSARTLININLGRNS